MMSCLKNNNLLFVIIYIFKAMHIILKIADQEMPHTTQAYH